MLTGAWRVHWTQLADGGVHRLGDYQLIREKSAHENSYSMDLFFY